MAITGLCHRGRRVAPAIASSGPLDRTPTSHRQIRECFGSSERTGGPIRFRLRDGNQQNEDSARGAEESEGKVREFCTHCCGRNPKNMLAKLVDCAFPDQTWVLLIGSD